MKDLEKSLSLRDEPLRRAINEDLNVPGHDYNLVDNNQVIGKAFIVDGDEIALAMEMPDWLTKRMPSKLPAGVSQQRSTVQCAYAYWSASKRMSILVSALYEVANGNRWIHLSIAKRHAMPSYEDLAWAQRVFVGRDVTGYQVFAAEDKHVTIHDQCLHVWTPLDGTDRFPDFRMNRKGVVPGI